MRDASWYRAKAMEFRTLASTARAAGTAEPLLALADDYDAEAARIEASEQPRNDPPMPAS